MKKLSKFTDTKIFFSSTSSDLQNMSSWKTILNEGAYEN